MWLLGVGIAAVLLLMAGVVVVLRYADTGPLIERAQAEISRQIGGEVDLGEVFLRFLPMPHITVSGGRFQVEGLAEGTVESLSIFPEILPVFRAEFKPSKILLTSPSVRIELPEPSPSHKTDKAPPGLPGTDGLKTSVSAIIARLTSMAPKMKVFLEDGDLRLSQQGREVLAFQDIDLRFDADSLRMELACASNLWQRLSIRWTFDPDVFPGEGRLSLFQFEPHRLNRWLPSNLPIRLGESLVNLDIRIQRSLQKHVQATIQGSLPKLTLTSRGKALAIRGDRFEGHVDLGDSEQRFTLTQLTLGSLRLNADGELIISSGSPKKAFSVHGTELDGAAVRRAVLFFAGSIPEVREIFDYLRGGDVPEITIASSGDSWDDLFILERIRIQGTMKQGRIRIPAVDLNLENVEGEALIADGFLNGTGLKGTVGNTVGKNGKLRVGFRGTDAPFHLEIDMDTDLAELPGHLKRLVPSADFQRWLNRVSQSSGRAEGHLVLGEALDDIEPAFRVDKLDMQAQLDFMPYPLVIDSGKMHFRDRTLRVENLVGRVQNSAVTQLTAELIWREETALRIVSGKADLDMTELFSWFSKVEGTAALLSPIDITNGRLGVESLILDGPLFSPHKWTYTLSGAAEGVTLKTPLAPKPLSIPAMIFIAGPDNFTIQSSRVEILDASLAIEGQLQGQIPNLDKLQVELSGTLGVQSHRLLEKRGALPSLLAIQAPITIREGRVRWNRSGSLALQGAILIGQDLQIAADLEKRPDAIEIRRLTLKDDRSDATVRVHYMGDELQIGFAGKLDKASVAKILDHRHLSAGTLSGDFSAHFHRNDPGQSNIKGLFSGESLVLPARDNTSVRIDRFMMLGTGSALTIQSIDALWEDSRVRISGRVDAMSDHYAAKLKIRSDRFRWDQLRSMFGAGPKETSGKGGDAAFYRWPVRASIDIESDRFVYGSYEWESVKAMTRITDSSIKIDVSEAILCGISTPGLVVIDADTAIQADFSAASRTPDLESTTSCLFKEADRFDGKYRFKGVVQGKGAPDTFLDSLEGSLEFHAQNGRVYGRGSFGVLKKILAFVNVTEVFAGSAPDFSAKGFGYHRIQVAADIDGQNVILKEAIVDGHNMKITGQGKVALEEQELDLTVIVAPLKTVDRAVGMLPVFGKILDGHLLTIPLKVTGPLSDPVVKTTAPGSAGRGLIGITERTLKLPFEMFQP